MENEFNFKFLGVVGSTNEEAKKLAEAGEKFWTVVVAEGQSAGRGRKGDSWESPLGGLYFSIILPKSEIGDLQTLTILAAFTIARILKENFGIEPLIKLPNDVLLNGKKICGILTENVIGNDVKHSVMGIGLNTNIDNFGGDLEKTATSLKIELKKQVDNKILLEKIVSDLKNQLKIISY
ncbi:MAG: biotin--[acetyl-CoA-carboxylase] ligase [Candidatus Pacebacteria bacterium]|nr:biotin--[acetyl-CoA-carboxylase] ligase [Candidatus Paceibacterota bacterium]